MKHVIRAATFTACLLTFTTAGAREPLGWQPTAGAKQSVPDLEAQVAYQRAFEAVVWAMPAASIYRFREGFFEAYGIADNDIVAFSEPSTPMAEMLTPNDVTPYIAAFTGLRKGPFGG
jgi:hypothetical protein